VDLFELVSLYPSSTGLPMTVWVSPRGHAGHDARMRVNTSHGRRMDPGQAAEVTIGRVPRVVEGLLSTADLAVVSVWIARNMEALIDYWTGQIDTAELVGRLVRL
jgi:hypothetical protein